MQRKIMKNFVKFLFCAVIFTALVYSCTKQENTTEILNEVVTTSDNLTFKGVSEKDGRLIFDNRADMDRLIKNIDKDRTQIDALRKAFPNLISSADACAKLTYEEYVNAGSSIERFKDFVTILTRSDGEQYIHPVVDNISFSSIVNKDGLFQIENKIYKMTYDNLYIVDIDKFIQSNKNTDLKSYPTVKVEKIFRENASLRGAWAPDCSNQFSESPARKLVGEVGQFATNGWSTISARSWSYKRFAGIWWWNNIDFIEVSGSLDNAVVQDQITGATFNTGPTTVPSVVSGKNRYFVESQDLFLLTGTDEGFLLLSIDPNCKHTLTFNKANHRCNID
jgi:hypothetical protein